MGSGYVREHRTAVLVVAAVLVVLAAVAFVLAHAGGGQGIVDL